MTNSRIPEPVRPILEKYISLLEQKSPGLIRAFYIVGSISLNEFNEHFSDIDFVAVLDRPASQADIESLRTLHKAIEEDFPGSKLSGNYLQMTDLGRFENEIQPHPYYQDGKLHEAGYFEINSITWWVLKNYGIAIWGNEPEDLPFTVDWELLVDRMKENLNSYWLGWTKRPGRFLVLLSDWGIQWTVLGVLRQYYTFRENSITTKIGAAKYALNCLPSDWHPLIQDAIDIREGKKGQHYHSRIFRMIGAVKFLKYIIKVSH